MVVEEIILVMVVMTISLSQGHILDLKAVCDVCSSRLILLAFLASTGVTFLVLGCALQQYKYTKHLYFRFTLVLDAFWCYINTFGKKTNIYRLDSQLGGWEFRKTCKDFCSSCVHS